MTIINADGYTAFEAFAEYSGGANAAPATLRLTPANPNTPPIEAHLTAAEASASSPRIRAPPRTGRAHISNRPSTG